MNAAGDETGALSRAMRPAGMTFARRADRDGTTLNALRIEDLTRMAARRAAAMPPA